MDLGSFLSNLCQRLQDYFYKSYGDPDQSHSADLVLPVDATGSWLPVIVMGNPCILTLKNADPDNELMYCWNKADAVGSRLSAGERIVYEGVSGTMYAKVSDPTKSSTLNFSTIQLRT